MSQDQDSLMQDSVIAVPAVGSTVELLNSIYDDDMVLKYCNANGKQMWNCKWCGLTFSGWNATKALHHVTKTPKQDIKICTVRIDELHQERYKALLEANSKRRSNVINANESLDRAVVSHNKKSAHALDTKKGKCGSAKKMKTGTTNVIMSSNSDNTTLSSKSPQAIGRDAKSFVQLTIGDAPNPTADSMLTMSIADLIHSCGLPFSLASHVKFRRVLSLAKAVNSSYNPPSRNQISGALLDLNYSQYVKKNTDLLKKDCKFYGITLFGDGATIKRMPLINVLGSSPHIPACVLEIVNCSKRMEEAEKKDATYIANIFDKHITSLETTEPNSVDCLIFDGASNVQKAGRILQAKYPRLEILHGAEHVLSLFFQDIFKIKELKFFNTIVKRAYKVFGSGSMQAPYAIFQQQSRLFNNGKNIGLIRAAETRFGGYAIVMLRFIRLREPLMATITSAKFTKLKVMIIIYIIVDFI